MIIEMVHQFLRQPQQQMYKGRIEVFAFFSFPLTEWHIVLCVVQLQRLSQFCAHDAFCFLIFCLLVLVRDTYGPTMRHLFFMSKRGQSSWQEKWKLY